MGFLPCRYEIRRRFFVSTILASFFFLILFCGPIEIKSRFIRKCAKKKKKKSVSARKQIEMMFFYFDIELIELMKEVESAPYYMVIRTGSRYISKPPVET